MERLLVLRLEAQGCSAEAVLNGVPLLRVGGAQAVASLPVHEFTLAGSNEIELIINPLPVSALTARGAGAAELPAEPSLSDGEVGASLRLLLPRVGAIAHPANARTLASLDWAPASDEVYKSPTRLQQAVDLPIAFARWRWLDAPVIAVTEGLKQELADYLLKIALGLAKGNPEPLIQASRLRLEELSQAYQRKLSDDVERLRAHILQLHQAQALKPALPSSAKLMLRSVAGGRLLECLAPDGLPLLRSACAGGGQIMWPLRVSAIGGEFYVLR
ncbi:hypothetical protein LNV09_17530 [Paucibacter sp. B2R-40]|uniref:hypothetical protein n=1 Tax=Paucibacter sp. B2R-40 TaxID=2893554 RepID=UPI0021E44515|nr:hypothetical protein [Paucibacter sp. B2R-40]MCV2355946.1 hypothetical protein [Paucibacter sp. B2R-40]